jgi:hypothetical protein
VLAFGAATDTLLTDAIAEVSRLDARQKAIDAQSEAGQWADDDDDEQDWFGKHTKSTRAHGSS